MKKINVESKIINDLNEETKVNTIGDFDEEENIILYYDKNILVHVIIGDKIIMRRNHPNYNLELIFEKNKKKHSRYKINDPEMDIEIEVDTLMLRRYNNGFYIEYALKLNKENMGVFSFNFKWEE